MNRTVRCVTAMLAAAFIFVSTSKSAAQYAAAVVSYNQGTTANGSYTNPTTAIGWPERFTGEVFSFPSVVSPFSPPFGTDEIVSVGEIGHITLRLSHYAVAQAGSVPEIGVFENLGIADVAYPSGDAGPDAQPFFDTVDFALVEVSEDGSVWYSLGVKSFDIPTNGYTDVTVPYSSTAGASLSDFQQPFIGTLNDFDGLKYSDPVNPDMLELLAGSGGGTWLDISTTPLTQAGYIRFSLANDNTSANLNFEIDAVTISHAAMGAPVVPEPSAAILLVLGQLNLLATRRQRRASR